MSYQVQIEIVKDLPVEQIKKWEDKVIYGMARATLDFTNSAHYFPYKTGALNISSMNKGVVAMGDKTYGLGYEGTTEYAPHVWKMGDNTKWTNPNTLPQWYYRTFEKHHTEITQLALKNAESELR